MTQDSRRDEAVAAHAAVEAELAALRDACAAQARRAMQLDHDLRTPLGTLAAAVEVLGSTGKDDPLLRDETLRVMERQLLRLRGLAEALHALGCEMQAAAGEPGA